jgi:rubrerythrin
MGANDSEQRVEFGQAIYTEAGVKLGTVRGFDESGFYVTAVGGVELVDEQSGSVHVEALMWRCWDCGEMGKLGEIPDECPDCGAPREELYHWQED